MATFIFETITAAQALAFDAATGDNLVFSNGASHGSAMTISYVAATALTPAEVVVTDTIDGHSVTFGAGVEGLGDPGLGAAIFSDGSTLVVGSNTAGDNATGTALGDAMFGGG